MSKFDPLKEQTKEAFTGGKFSEQHFRVVSAGEGMSIIQGLPSCPECGAILAHNFTHSFWRCLHCKTEWDEDSLVEALQNERAAAMKLKEMAENDA